MKNNLYALCDKDVILKYNKSIEEFILIAKEKDAKIIQYRNKNGTFEEKLADIRKIKELTLLPIIINDSLELVNEVAGVHIGQEDLLSYMKKFAIKTKKEFFDFFKLNHKNKLIGLSTHNKEEIIEANEFDLDYIGLGAYRDTSTKKDAKKVSDILNLIPFSSHKVAVIGGVRLDDEIQGAYYKVICSGLLH
jgi:thiamine-phosphate pyrophosphorylase